MLIYSLKASFTNYWSKNLSYEWFYSIADIFLKMYEFSASLNCLKHG